MVAELAFYIAMAGYAAATALFFAHLTGYEPSERAARSAPRVFGVAVLANAVYVVIASLDAHVCPVLSLHFFGSIAAVLASGLYLLVRRRARIDALGAFLAPVALTLLLGLRFTGAPEREVSGPFLALHVTLNLLGVALFLLATVAAALYLVEERSLKRKRLVDRAGRLPPLDALDRAEHRFLLIGFPLLTLGIVTGTVSAHRVGVGSVADVVRALLAWITWLLFGSVLLARSTLGWRGPRAAYGTIAGFVFTVLVLLGYLVRRLPGVGA